MPAARASSVTLVLSGQVNSVDPALNGAFQVGDTATVTLRDDTAAPVVASTGQVAGAPLRPGFFALCDGTATALSDTALPDTALRIAPTLAALPSADLVGPSFCKDPSCAVASAVGFVEADLTSMTATPSVPEPGSRVLAAVPLPLLARRRCRAGRVVRGPAQGQSVHAR